MILHVYTDGASRGNPGHSGIAYIITNVENKPIESFSKYIGIVTNNYAEYTALLYAIRRVREITGEKVFFYLDSELVVKQLNGAYKVKSKTLQKLYNTIVEESKHLDCVFIHIPRELNKLADKLAKEASFNIINNS
ncbi:MAG: ribonuclease HI family protein [Deferribacterota bacterium]|nr:ribonuclease HI family protein [Deferribacterota bacterium]